MRAWILTVLLSTLFLGALPVQANNAVTIPADILREMEAAGIGKWRTIRFERGDSISVPRPLLCEGCGESYIPSLADDHVNCPNCGYLKTATTRRFLVPQEVVGRQTLRIFVPTEPGAAHLANSASRTAITSRLAQLFEYDLVPCASCGRHNNPGIRRQCYSCGTRIEDDQLQPARRETVRTADVDSVPAEERVTRPAPPRPQPEAVVESTAPPRTLRGGVTTAASAVGGAGGTSSRLQTSRSLPRIPPRLLLGAGSTAVVVGAVVLIGHLSTRDDVHVSKGRVEVISRDEVRIHVPGFADPLILTYDPDEEFDGPLYSRTTLEPYMNVDTVDVWWTSADGVIQILPIDLFSEIDEILEEAAGDS